MSDSDPLDYSERRRISGRVHTCDECGKVIPEHVPHLGCSGIFDGEERLYRLCQLCELARIITIDWARKLDPPILDPPPLGALWTWIEAHLDLIPEE